MTRIITSIAAVSLLTLAACGGNKTEEATEADTGMNDPITTEAPAAPATDPTMDPMAMPSDDMSTASPEGEGSGDEDSPGNAGNDKGRAGSSE